MNRRALLLALAAIPAAAQETADATEYRRLYEEINALALKASPMIQWAATQIMLAPWRPWTLVSGPHGTVMEPSLEMRRLHAFLQASAGICPKGLWS